MENLLVAMSGDWSVQGDWTEDLLVAMSGDWSVYP
jgi:hypothetical protein